MISARDIATVGGEPMLVSAVAETREREVVVGLASELPEPLAAALREATQLAFGHAMKTAERLGFSVEKLQEQMDEHPLLGERIYLGIGDMPIRLCLT